MAFGLKRNANRARPSFVRQHGLAACPKAPRKSVAFVYDQSAQPAVKIRDTAVAPGKLSLTKTYEAADKALGKIQFRGLRMEVVVMVDGSGSMDRLFDNGMVERMLVRTLGFALNVDKDGQIPVIVYGSDVSKAFIINADNYQDAGKMLRKARRSGTTNMTGAIQQARKILESADGLSMIINITDGEPDNQLTMQNEIIEMSSYPIILKNLDVYGIDFLELLDEMPSYIEIEKDEHKNPKLDENGNLKLYINNDGVRYVDMVDSQSIDPLKATDEEFADALAEEIPAIIEAAARAGLLTGIDGYDRMFA